MDIDERINRRRRHDDRTRLVLDYETLAPVTHVSEPVDRGPLLEQLLDYFDPVFDGDLPSSAYVHGPCGSGKSAVLTALVDHLEDATSNAESIIHTSTRATEPATPAVAYLDARGADSAFGIYHAVLTALVDEAVPERGVGTGTLRDRLADALADHPTVVVVDHVDEPASLTREDVLDLFAPVSDSLEWVCVGTESPAEPGWSDAADTCIEVQSYDTEVLVDVLTARASAGLARRAIDHDGVRTLARWADGNAHDALAALFVAADSAATAGRRRIATADLEAGMADVPRPGVSIGRTLARAPNHQAVLRELIALDSDQRATVRATTDAIADSPRTDLSASTIERLLYELADAGILERRANDDTAGQGRPPSRLEPRFSPTVFRRLYDLRTN